MTDVPTGLTFVDPNEADATYRVVLWASPGEGKSVGAASAPDPIVVLSADRPGAYRFARRLYPDKDVREVRYQSSRTLDELYLYIREHHEEIATVVVDPFHNVYDALVNEHAGRREIDVEHYQAANKKLLGFLYSLRPFGVNVVLVAHERLNDGKKGDGKLYPQLGGPALINKVLAEADIVAHVEREPGADDEPARYVAQLTPTGNLVCKESTGALGDRRPLDLAEWFATAAGVEASDAPDESDLPWNPEFDNELAQQADEAPAEPQQQQLGEAA